MKKLTAFLLVCCMILTLGITALAGTSGEGKPEEVREQASARESEKEDKKNTEELHGSKNSSEKAESKYNDFEVCAPVEDQSEKEYSSLKWHWGSADSGKATAEILLDLNGEKTLACLTGEMECYDTIKGSFGVFDGWISDKNADTRITAALCYADEKEQLVTIVIGEAASGLKFLKFGEYTDRIDSICKAKMNSDESASADDETSGNQTIPRSVDGTIRPQSTDTVSVGGNALVTVSSFHANELINQGTTIIYGKINSHVSAFNNYLRTSYGLNAEGSYVSSKPDTYNIDMRFISNYIYANGNYTPANGATSVNISIPVLFPGLGWQTIHVPLTLYSCTVSTGSVTSSGLINKVVWNVYKNGGWWSSSMDGYSSTNAGGTVSSDFTQASSITSPVYQTVRVSGSLRYEVQYIVPADNGYSEMETYYYYVWTGSAIAESSMKLLP